MKLRYEADVHGMTVAETAVLLNQLLDTLSKQYGELIVVHGYHQHVLLDYIRKEYKHPRIERMALDMNPGQTIIYLKEEYDKPKKRRKY